MKLRLIHKLLIALFVSTSVVLLLILWLAQVNIGRGFQEFLTQQEQARLPLASALLADWYRQNGSWESLQDKRRKFNRMLEPVLSDGSDRGPEPGARQPPPRNEPPAGRGP